MTARNVEKKKLKGKPLTRYDFWTGEEVMRWWLGENPNQIRIEDLITEERTES